MTEEELKQFWYKNVRVKCTNGNVFEGYCGDFTDAYDNDDPELASITVEVGKLAYEIFENEIISIEEI